MSVVEYVPAIGLRLRWSSRTSSRTSAGSLSRCDSRSRIRAASVSPVDAEAPTALITYAAAPRPWAATCASAAACPAARAANFAGSGNPRAAAFAAKAAHRASPMRTSPLTTRDIDGVARSGVAHPDPSAQDRDGSLPSGGAYLQKERLRAVDSRVRLPPQCDSRGRGAVTSICSDMRASNGLLVTEASFRISTLSKEAFEWHENEKTSHHHMAT
jgi:hypothetical protein